MTEYTIDEKKCNFRKDCIKRLQASSKLAKIKKDKYINLEILKLIQEKKVKRILAYIPLGMEVNILPLIKELRRRKIYEVYVPYIENETFKAVKYRLPIKKKIFGIKEPKNSNLKVKLDLAIIPIVGIDSTYRRVGFGKGMYDRFFDRLKYKPISLFTSLSLCKSKTIVTSTHDIKADYIITF